MTSMTTTSRLTVLAATLALLCLSVACGGDNAPNSDAAGVNCSNEPCADTYTANMVKSGSSGSFIFLLIDSTPGPPAKGDNSWNLRLTDTGDTPIDGATLEVTPFMPDHGHGTPIRVVVTPAGSNGEYTAAPINLWMPGLWEVTIDATAGADSDSVVYRFFIEG